MIKVEVFDDMMIVCNEDSGDTMYLDRDEAFELLQAIEEEIGKMPTRLNNE